MGLGSNTPYDVRVCGSQFDSYVCKKTTLQDTDTSIAEPISRSLIRITRIHATTSKKSHISVASCLKSIHCTYRVSIIFYVIINN